MHTIRTARLPDLEAVRALYARSALSVDAHRRALLDHPDALELGGDGVRDGRTRVAVSGDGAVLGFSTTIADGDAWELVDLFVEPAVQRRGVGRSLLIDVLDRARAGGATRVEVTAGSARPFYERAGFRHDREVPTRFGPAARMTRDL